MVWLQWIVDLHELPSAAEEKININFISGKMNNEWDSRYRHVGAKYFLKVAIDNIANRLC